RKGSVALGWSVVGIFLLAARPPQCYRCWGLGQTRAGCTAAKDRSGICYRCGRGGHTVQKCESAPHCAVCQDAGREA
ncbi:hypothetical protein EAI_03315, partial [Harpegnathos saltator]